MSAATQSRIYSSETNLVAWQCDKVKLWIWVMSMRLLGVALGCCGLIQKGESTSPSNLLRRPREISLGQTTWEESVLLFAFRAWLRSWMGCFPALKMSGRVEAAESSGWGRVGRGRNVETHLE